MVLGGASGGGGGHKHVSADALSRTRSRDMDIAESYYLLLELGTQEPVMQHCIKTLQGICLAQGVKLASKGVHDQDPATKKWDSGATTQFQKHIDKYFVAFCEEAIRCFYVCGFVPWHVRRLASTGDLVPEVLPLGTFTWCAPPAVPFVLFTFLIFYHTTGTSNSEPKRKSATGWRRRSGASVR